VTPLSFDVITPLGKAACIGLIAEDDKPEWVCFIYATGEPWFFPNQLIRRFPYATLGSSVSDFDPKHINANLRKAIARYKENRWL